jgi:hypothetical protein
VREALQLSGLIYLLSAAIKVWRQIPAGLRGTAAEVLRQANTYGDLLTNPTFGGAYQAMYDSSMATLRIAGPLLDTAWTTDALPGVANWIYANTGADARSLANALSRIPELQHLPETILADALADALPGVGEYIPDLVSYVVNPVSLAGDTLEYATEAAEDAWHWATSWI